MRGLIGLALLVLAGDPTDEALLHGAQQHFRLGVAQVRSVAASRRAFAQAADDFRRLHDRGVRSPALYLALGNAAALAGRWPRAIWAYHCGLQLDPGDAALRAQLDYARTLVAYPPGDRGRPAPDAWPAWLPRPGAGVLLPIAAAAHALAWLAGGWWYVRRRPLALAAALGLGALAFTAGAGAALDAARADYDRTHPLLIVAADGTPLHRGNGPSYPLDRDVPSLPAGLEARQLHRRGTWLQVQLTTGEVGWVRADRVLVVRPGAVP